MGAPPDDQLALVARCRASNEWVCFEDVDSLNDLANPSAGVLDVMPSKVIKDTLEIVANFRRKLDPRHSYRTSFLAAGRRDFLPATRFSRYERISFQGMVLPVATIPA
jgi:hypothetical protein